MKKYGSMIDGEIPRSLVKKLREKYITIDGSDEEFIEWLRRNHGTGYSIEIVES